MFCNKNLQHGGLQVWPDFRIGRNVRTWMRWEYDVRLKRNDAGIVDQLGMSGIRLDRKPRKPGLADACGFASALRVRTRSTARRRIMSHKEHKGHKRFVWSLRKSCSRGGRGEHGDVPTQRARVRRRRLSAGPKGIPGATASRSQKRDPGAPGISPCYEADTPDPFSVFSLCSLCSLWPIFLQFPAVALSC